MVAARTFIRRNAVLAACVALTFLGLLYIPDLRAFIRVQFEPPSDSGFGTAARVSQLHYLVPASTSNIRLCYSLASAAANGYPAPFLLGWNGQGELDIAVTHLAKLRTLRRYLSSLGPETDDDLVLMVDGYDVIHQLPVEIMVERYFDVAREADNHLAERMGISTEELHERGMRQSVFLGPDKLCWPQDPRAARCWAAPHSSLADYAFGAKVDDGFSQDPRWLNSGTLMGPVGDVKRVVDATMDEIKATYDINFWQSDSDQYYLSNVWGRQEYWRSKLNADQPAVEGGPPERVIPQNISESGEFELHMGIEYQSALFQTRTWNDPFIGYLQFDEVDYSSRVQVHLAGQEEHFRPYLLQMPKSVQTALTKLYESIAEMHARRAADKWLRMAHLGTNLVTKQIYGLWHCTGAKEGIDTEFTRMWFYPFVKSLLKVSVKSSQRIGLISPKLMDGRKWSAKWFYPAEGELEDEYGGAWSDEVAGGKFVPWKHICGAHEGILFWGQEATGMG